MKTKVDKVLTVDEVAKIRSVGHEAIMTAIRKEKLKATFFHGKWHIRESSLREYWLLDQEKILIVIFSQLILRNTLSLILSLMMA